MTQQQKKLYSSERIHIAPRGYDSVCAVAAVSVYSRHDLTEIDKFSAVLTIDSGACHLQIYPEVNQLDALILALSHARAAMTERIATQEIAA